MSTIKGNVITNSTSAQALHWSIKVDINSITIDTDKNVTVSVSGVYFVVDYARVTTSGIRLTANSTSYSLFDGAITGTWPSSDIVLKNDTTGSKIIQNQQYTIRTNVSASYASKPSAYTQTINFKLTRSNGNWVGTTTATTSVSVSARPSYTVTYNANGGSSTPASQTVYFSYNFTTADKIARTGYTFSYWNTKADGSGNNFIANHTYPYDRRESMTLYAKWTANTYSVTLNNNSGSGGTTSVTATYNSAMPAITVPTKSGWTFQGYYDTSAATGGTQYYTSSGASARAWNKTSAATLYARWSRSITFKHGKSNASFNVVTQYYGGTVTPPSIKAISGWTALGWRDDTSAGTKEYGANNTTAFSYTGTATTLYAVYYRVLTLTYTNGGGSGTAPIDSNATQYYNSNGSVSTASFTLAANTFTAPTDSGGGWAFSKWAAGAKGASWSWTPGVDAGIAISTSAVWTRTITFKSGINSATSKTATQTRGSAVTVPSGTATPSGWTLLGWREDTTATTAARTGSSFLPSATTLYAVFSRTLTLSYTNGGGTGTAPSNTTATQYYNSYGNKSTASFTLRANTFTRAGYYFSKWGAGNANATWSWSPAVDAAVSTSTAAQWTSYYVTLRYNVNGGTVTTGTDTTRWRASNGRLQRSTDSGATWADVTHNIYTYNVAGDSTTNMWNVGTPPILKTGYSVKGTEAWNTKTDGTGIALNQDYSTSSTTNAVTAYRLNGNKDLTSNITIDVYPKWVPNTYTVTLNKNNGSGGTDSVTATYNSAMPAATMPTRTGYTFDGYYDATSGGTQYYTAAGASTRAWNKTSNTTLYAHWTEKTATLTYNNSGLSGSTVPSAVTMKYTTATTLTAGTAPSGYSFYGWATSEARAKTGEPRDYTGTQQYKAANVEPIAKTLYAIWYGTVTYNANGHGTAPSATTMYYTPQPKAAAAISATGYTFNGWNTQADGNGTSYTAGSSVLKNANEYKANYILYAKWTANTYAVTLHRNGGTGGTSSVTATYDSAMPSITKPTRAGYIFQGYYDAESGGTQYYTAAGASARAWNKTSATTLYAHWSAISDFTSGDYTFHVIATGEIQATATDKTKTTYGPIPVVVTKDGVTLKVTSIDNCFNGCNNLTGDIFVSHATGADALKSYNNVFSTTNPIYILATNSSVDHSVWKSVANQKTNINYLSTDDEYSYIVDPSTHKYSIKAINKTKTSYNNPKSTLSSATTWTADSMANCFQGCTYFNTSPTIPNTITNMSSCFQGCTGLVNAPTIPSTVTNMNSCFSGCNVLQRVTNIPANVTTMVNCFNGCYSLRGNIKVNNQTVTSSTDIFTGAGSTQNQIYIINGLGSDSTLASTWRTIAATNDNVHYEIDDLNLSNATFAVKRQIYTDNTIESINGYVGAYINSSFDLLIANIKNMPEGWTIDWSSTKPVEKMGTTSIGNINGTSKDTTANKLYFNDATRFLINNNKNINVTNYYTITSTDNITFSKAVTYSAELPSTSANKKIIDAFYKNSDYIYTVIDNSSTPKKVAAYAFDRSNISYSNIPSTITVDGINYTVTSLYYPSYNTDGTLDTNNYIGGCFEGCSAMTTAPSNGIPSTIIDARNCFKNCSKLTGNIVVNGNPSNYDNIFTGTVQPIYIINGGNSNVPNLWRSIIAKQYTNVHFEGDDNAPPIVSPILVSRGNYRTVTVNNEQINIWTEDDTDVWVKLDITPLLQKTALPRGWQNTLIKKIYIIFDDDIIYETPGERFVIEGEVVYEEPQSKTLSSSTEYYTKDTYTLVENPTQEALNNRQYYIKGYNPNKIIIYFKAVKGSDPEEEINYQTNVKVSMRDFFCYPTSESSGEGIGTEIVYAVFAMMDFFPGGHGMAIGQQAFQEGLEIGLPVLIGEELIPPYENDVYIPVQGHMAQSGKTYYKYVNNEYVEVENPNNDTGFEEFEEYYEKVTAVDLNSRQLVIGKYNISNSSTKNALFIIGNGTDNTHRSNLLTVNSDSIVSTVSLTATEFLTTSGKKGVTATNATAVGSTSIPVYVDANGQIQPVTMKNAANALIDSIDTATANWTDSTLIVTSDASGDTNLYYRRPATNAWNYIKGKADANYLKLIGGSVTGATSFGDSVSIDALTAGSLVVNGNVSFVNARTVVNNLVDNLELYTSVPIDGDTYIASYADGKNVTHNGVNTYGRRPIAKLWDYIKNKLDSSLTTNKLIYANSSTQLTSIPNIAYFTGNNTASTPATYYRLHLHGSTYGNTAANMISNTAGLFSFGDGGPQITFDTSTTPGGGQAGAIIFTDNDTAGTGVSWHFVSNQTDWNVTSNRFHARTGISIGTNLPVTSHALYVTGSGAFTDSFYTGAKRAYNDGNAGWYIGADGTAWCDHNNSTGAGIGIMNAAVQYSRLYISTVGTTSATGATFLMLGNATAAGTANNSQGYLRLYGPNTGYSNLTYANSTSNVTNTLPATTGTLINTAGGQQINGITTFYREGTTTNNYPAGIAFSVKDTTTGITDNNAYIYVYEDHASSAYGTNMVIRSGGGMFIGGGESPSNHYSAKGASYTGEDTFITTDDNIYIQAKGNTIADRLGMKLNTSHQLVPIKADVDTNNVGSIGTSDYKWNAMYATTFYGSLSGNATSATKATQDGNGATISSTYLKLSGGTMTGSITLNNETTVTGKIARKIASGGGWAYTPFRIIGNDNADFAHIGVLGNANALTYMYIGSNNYDGGNLRIYPDGYIKIYSNSVETSFGCQGSNFNHIYTTGSNGHAFNKSIAMVDSGTIGTTGYPTGNIIMKYGGALQSISASGGSTLRTLIKLHSATGITIGDATIKEIKLYGSLLPQGSTSDERYLGNSSNKWSYVYASNGTIQTSDKKNKDILGTITDAKQLILNLKPINYMWKDGDHRRIHMGFVAQDIATICKKFNKNLALTIAHYKDNENKFYYGENVDDTLLNWGLNYQELIAPIVAVIQEQQKEIEQLKQEIKLLKK